MQSEILGGAPVFEQIEQIHEIEQIQRQSSNYSVGTARQRERNSEWICQDLWNWSPSKWDRPRDG